MATTQLPDLDNPYRDEFPARDDPDHSLGTRMEMIDEYSWAVPTQQAINALRGRGPILELGCGNGYWAWLLRQAGVDVRAVDIEPPDNPFTDIEVADGLDILEHGTDRTLFLCWPPRDFDLAHRALDAYDGKTFIYVGEQREHDQSNEAFFDLLEAEFGYPRTTISLPSWRGCHDNLYIYNRIDAMP